MASTKKKKEIRVDSGAVPASEERVYLYSKSGAERIAEVDVGKNEVAVALGEPLAQEQNPNAEVELPLPALKDSRKTNEKSATTQGPRSAAGSGTRKDVTSKRPPRSPVAKESVGDTSTPRSSKNRTKRVSFSESAKKESVESSTGQTGGKKSPSDAIKDLLANFGNSVDQAEQISKESGVVHLMEEYDTEGKLKATNVPEKTEPESASGTSEDANEDLFDMTSPEKAGSELGQKEYLKMLIEAEREEELNQQREETKRMEHARKKDMNEFGKGFAKGFFDKKGNSSDKSNKEPKSILRNSNDRPPVDTKALLGTEHGDVDANGDADDRPLERQAVQSNIVERGLGTRRRRRKAAQKKSRAAVLDLHAAEEANAAEPEGAVVPIEEEEQSTAPRMSKFKQMRALQQQER